MSKDTAKRKANPRKTPTPTTPGVSSPANVGPQTESREAAESEPGDWPRDPHRLAKMVLRRLDIEPRAGRLWHYRGEWYRWNGRKYSQVQSGDFTATVVRRVREILEEDRKRLAKADGDKKPLDVRVTRTLIGDVTQALKSLRLLPAQFQQPLFTHGDFNSPPGGVIAVQNGLLDVAALLSGSDKPLSPHNQDWFSTICLDYPWEPHAECKRWLAFLDETLEGDSERIALLQEWFGYCLVYDTSLQRFMILLGEGADGKSVVLIVLTTMLGPANVSNVPLELFGQRFQLVRTIGKLANIAADIADIDRVAEGLLKAYVAGDRIYIDRKFLEGVEVAPTARLIFSTNTLPRFADRSSGVWRRLVILPFRISLPRERQDPHLVDSLAAERPGILNWAFEGLRRLRARGRFTEPALCQESLDHYRAQSNPVRTFFAERLISNPDGLIVCDVLRQAYRLWCENEGFKPLDAAQFGLEVHRTFKAVVRRKVSGGEGGRVWAYTGIDWTATDHA